jgi:TfoX/Sxy family transcriptional regulator of competence genes
MNFKNRYMPFNENLANRVRASLVDCGLRVEEKTMFRGLCFMVDEKMCICVSDDELLCRVGPVAYAEAIERNGVKPMIHNGKVMSGYVYVDEAAVKSKKALDYWVTKCLDFNKHAKASKKKPSKKIASRKASAVVKKK